MGMGEIYFGDPPADIGEMPQDLTQTRFDQASALATQLLTALRESISTVQDLTVVTDVIEAVSALPTSSGAGNIIPAELLVLDTVPTMTAMPTLDFPATPADYVDTTSEYGSDVTTELVNLLLAELRNGSTGLTDAVEQALYDKAKARQELENNKVVEKVVARSEGLGWSKPPGAYSSAMRMAEAEVFRANQLLNYEVMNTQAELAQKNKFHVTEMLMAGEKSLMDFIIQSKEAGIKIYLGTVEAYKAKISAIVAQVEAVATNNKALADVYGELCRAKAAIVSVYAEFAKITSEEFIALLNVAVEKAKAAGELAIAQLNLQGDMAKSASQYLAQVTAATIGSASATTSVQYQAQKSEQRQWSESHDQRESESVEHIHQYNHDV